MQINQKGLDLIKFFEGFRSEAYEDIAGYPTIGYGHRVRSDESFPDPISEEDAASLLETDVQKAEAAVSRLVKIYLNSNQFSALVSFTYNMGEGALAGSTLLRELNVGNYDAVSSEILRWNKATVDGVKVVVVGLAKRRTAEHNLWLKPEAESTAHVPTIELTKFHVHVYWVAGQVELDVEAQDKEEAKKKALFLAGEIHVDSITQPDCTKIAIIPE
jgi:lysozyme